MPLAALAGPAGGPALVITNFPNTTTSFATPRPVLQIEGYSAGDLAALYIEHPDADGNLILEDGFLTGRAWQDLEVVNTPQGPVTNLVGRATRHNFQFFDVELAPGANELRLHAFDAAGRESVRVLNVTFSTVGDTAAPALDVHWPPDGAALLGTNFMARGTGEQSQRGLSLGGRPREHPYPSN